MHSIHLLCSNKVIRNQPPTSCFTSLVYEQKSSPVKLSSFHLFGKAFHSPPLKSLPQSKIGSRVFDSWYSVETYQRKRFACYCYQKLRQTNFFKNNFGKCSQIGSFKERNSTWKTLILRQSPSDDMLQSIRFTAEITQKSPRGNSINCLIV